MSSARISDDELRIMPAEIMLGRAKYRDRNWMDQKKDINEELILRWWSLRGGAHHRIGALIRYFRDSHNGHAGELLRALHWVGAIDLDAAVSPAPR